ncbi:MAG: alkaline phosphatase family protein [Nanoarchaeota archaeon]|nr:alkaline phosphatase family protein [Nanoarchaeota archaeon]
MKLFIVLDGIADRPCIALENLTPLEAAKTPNLDFLTKFSKLGYCYVVDKDVAPESDTAVISLLGYNPYKQYTGRGPLEALGAKIKLETGDLALRCNFGTLSEGKLIDRRAGRTLTTEEASELSEEINTRIKLSHHFIFKNTVDHRGVLLIKGPELSGNISNTDPAYKKEGPIAKANENFGEKVLQSKPLDNKKSSKTSAELINEFVKQSYTVLKDHPINIKRKEKNLLPANVILTRDAGASLPQFEKKHNWAILANMPLEKGIARVAGINILSFERLKLKTNNLYKNLQKNLILEIKEAKKHIKRGYFETYYIHFKETDIPGHDNKPIEKQKMIEILDKKFFSFLKKLIKKYPETKIIITADHSTPCSIRAHSSDSVPVLLYSEGSGNSQRFTEEESKQGALGELKGQELLKKLNFE